MKIDKSCIIFYNLIQKMPNSEEKKRWKQEAEQLKNDLDNRPKVVVKRPVKIRVGQPNHPPHSNVSSKNSKQADDWQRSQINISSVSLPD